MMKVLKKSFNKVIAYLNKTILLLSIFIGSCGQDQVKLIPVKSGNTFQYINPNGKILINSQFGEATVFRNGLALVRTSGDKPKFGFIGEEGKYIIPPNYVSATVFSENLAWVVSPNSPPVCINTDGKIMFQVNNNVEYVRVFTEDLAGFCEINKNSKERPKWGFIDTDGNTRINAVFSDIGYFAEGRCPVGNSVGKWGYIDKDGQLLINYQFDFAGSFKNGLAIVLFDGKLGVIDLNGRFVINPQFDEIQMDEDMFLVKQQEKYGWVDKEGKTVITPQFNHGFPFFENNLAAVKMGNSYGFIDKSGRFVINPQFSKALPFNRESALVVNSGKVGFVNSAGKYLINPQFDGVAEDFERFITTGCSPFGSKYNQAKSDFFDIGEIISRINIDSMEGLTFNVTMSEILTKFNKSEKDLSYSSDDNRLVNERVSNHAHLFFSVIGNPWIREEYDLIPGPYYFKDFRYSFNSNFKPSGFRYDLLISTEKGFEKDSSVINEIEKSLTTYKKSIFYRTGESIFKNNKAMIKLSNPISGHIKIEMFPLNELDADVNSFLGSNSSTLKSFDQLYPILKNSLIKSICEDYTIGNIIEEKSSLTLESTKDEYGYTKYISAWEWDLKNNPIQTKDVDNDGIIDYIIELRNTGGGCGGMIVQSERWTLFGARPTKFKITHYIPYRSPTREWVVW